MIQEICDSKYGFKSLFNDETGMYIRGIGREDDPFMADYPHLIDIGIMGYCAHGQSGLCLKAEVECYQDGLHQHRPNMTLDNYRWIIEQSGGRLFEVALGGRGDPDMHENFEDILKCTREYGIVPNFTTSGLGMTPEKALLCKKYCGAVAVSMYSRLHDTVPDILYRKRTEEEKKLNPGFSYSSFDDTPVLFDLGNVFEPVAVERVDWFIGEYDIYGMGKRFRKDEMHHIPKFMLNGDYEMYSLFSERNEGSDNYTMQAIKMLLDAGVKTNIHYVLSKSTIREALIRLKNPNGFPKGINAIVFLLHKPVGLGSESEVLTMNDPLVKEFFEITDATENFPFKIGFDSCSVPGKVNFCKDVESCSLDTCEGARFSMYIDSDMMAMPCSFDNQDLKYAVKLINNQDGTTVSIQDAWESNQFDRFRDKLRKSCPNCPKRELCMGGCPLRPSVVLCNSGLIAREEVY